MVSTSHKAASFNLPRSRLRLRQDVRCTPLVQRGETFYQLEVPGTGQFYRLGYAESVFVSLLDGQTTFTTALALTTQHLAEQQLTTQPPSPPAAPVNTVSAVDPVGVMDAENSVTVSLPPSPAAAAPLQTLTTSQATSLYLWLLENGLGTLVDAGPESGELTPRRSAGARTGGRAAVACPNPFWLKLPLGNPDRLLGYLLPATSWIFSPFFTMVGLLVIAAGAVTLSLHWERFLAASTQVFSPHNWLWLAAAWLLLKVIHELAHALVCRRYGGEVRDVGLILILFAPLAYVDVSSAWRFPSKWSRIHVAVAGIYAELLLAALAAVAWQQVESPMVGHLLYNLILMASVSTVVFNANPLMRFDGYFMLSDWLEIPNLYAAGSKAVARQCRRLFLGERSGELRYGGKLAWWIGAYGWAALGWRIAVCGSLLLAASLLFHGAGIALSALALLAWVGRPLWAGWTGCLRRWQRQPGQVLRAAGLSILLGWLGCLFLFYLPSPARVSAPGIVDYEAAAPLRSLTGGRVAEILVVDGQQVAADELLLRLEHPDVQELYLDLQLALQQAELRRQLAIERHETATTQIAAGEIVALRKQLAAASREYESLQVRAPRAGKVVRRGLAQLLGTYVQEGEELLTIGREEAKELIVSLDQRDFDSVAPRTGQTVAVRVGSQGRFRGTLRRLEPRASTRLVHPALSAVAGGPLDVVAPQRNPTATQSPELELTQPRFRAVVALPAEQAAVLHSGQRGQVLFGNRQGGLGTTVYQFFSDWLTQASR